jgi:hypothetical protein
MVQFGLAVIATRNCLLHGISSSSIEAVDGYISRSSFINTSIITHRKNVVKQSVIDSCEISITELTIYISPNMRQIDVNTQRRVIRIRLDQARVGRNRL